MKIIKNTDTSKTCIICNKPAELIISNGNSQYAFCQYDLERAPILLAQMYAKLNEIVTSYRGPKHD